MDSKICNKCDTEKSELDFYKRSGREDKRTICISCLSKQSKVWGENNRELVRDISKKLRSRYVVYWTSNNPYDNPYDSKTRKKCCGCLCELDISRFGICRPMRDGLRPVCKKCFIQREYASKIANNTRLYNTLRRRNEKNKRDTTFTKQELASWLVSQPKRCHYCEIPDKLIEDILSKEYGFHRRTKRLTVDRKDNEKGYIIENMCLACSVCNVLKNSFFTEKEFKEIAIKYIKPRWKK